MKNTNNKMPVEELLAIKDPVEYFAKIKEQLHCS